MTDLVLKMFNVMTLLKVHNVDLVLVVTKETEGSAEDAEVVNHVLVAQVI